MDDYFEYIYNVRGTGRAATADEGRISTFDLDPAEHPKKKMMAAAMGNTMSVRDSTFRQRAGAINQTENPFIIISNHRRLRALCTFSIRVCAGCHHHLNNEPQLACCGAVLLCMYVQARGFRESGVPPSRLLGSKRGRGHPSKPSNQPRRRAQKKMFGRDDAIFVGCEIPVFRCARARFEPAVRVFISLYVAATPP